LAPMKGERRENKRHKKRYGMQVRGRSVMTLQREISKKAKRARKATTQ